jgi:glutathione S-transferase
MKLYSHWRSSASYRVRIALNLKALTCEHVTLDLDKSHADQHRPEYRRVNPQGVVPSLELDNGTAPMQSMAIIEYLEEAWPESCLLPRRALQVRQRWWGFEGAQLRILSLIRTIILPRTGLSPD